MSVDFLKIEYTGIDFLINRTQFASSLFLEKEFAIKSSFRYFSTVTIYRNRYLLVFDFDKYLHSLFQCRSENKAKLILITDTDSFSNYGRKVFERLNLKKKHKQLSTRYMAVKVSSETEIVSVPLEELKLVPGALRMHQSQYGILGLRFHREKQVQYFIDSERMIVNNLLKKEGVV